MIANKKYLATYFPWSRKWVVFWGRLVEGVALSLFCSSYYHFTPWAVSLPTSCYVVIIISWKILILMLEVESLLAGAPSNILIIISPWEWKQHCCPTFWNMISVDMSRRRRIQNLNEHSLPALLFITSSRLHRLLLALLKNVVGLSSTQLILIFMDGIGSKELCPPYPWGK